MEGPDDAVDGFPDRIPNRLHDAHRSCDWYRRWPQGSLFVADDDAGLVYRIRPSH